MIVFIVNIFNMNFITLTVNKVYLLLEFVLTIFL